MYAYHIPNTLYYVRIDSPGQTFQLRNYQQLLDQQQIYLHEKIIRGEGDVVQSYENSLNRIQMQFQAGPWPISAPDLQIVFGSIKRETTSHSQASWLHPRELKYCIFWCSAAFSPDLQIRGNGTISKFV